MVEYINCEYCGRKVKRGINDFHYKQHLEICTGVYNPKKKNNVDIDWKRNNKIALRRPTDRSFANHELIKMGVVLMLRTSRDYKNSKNTAIYTEYPIGNRIADVYVETKERGKVVKLAYEIQKQITPKWQREVEEYYLENEITPIIIPEKEVIRLMGRRIKNNYEFNKRVNIMDELLIILRTL